MKKVNIVLFSLVIMFSTKNTFAQDADPTIAVLPSNAGVVAVGQVIDLTVTITNTVATGSIAAGFLRPTVAVPPSVRFLATSLQTALPAGWTILTNTTGTQIRFCNSSYEILPSGQVDVVFKVRGFSEAAAATSLANINFGNGFCANGAPVPGDDPGNNSASTTIQVIAAPLPLTLLNFNATLVNCNPSLTWVTENELNTDRFEIERANATGSDFTKVGTVAANGNSNSQIRYNFIDSKTDALSDKVFYRLKMIDKDGTFKYSNIATVLVSCKTAKAFVYPNPVQDDKLFVSLAGTVGSSNATLISTSGQIILRSKMSNGTNSLIISNIADGVYILNVKDANGFDKNIKVSIKH